MFPAILLSDLAKAMTFQSSSDFVILSTHITLFQTKALFDPFLGI
jgi:hypothetical protein